MWNRLARQLAQPSGWTSGRALARSNCGSRGASWFLHDRPGALLASPRPPTRMRGHGCSSASTSRTRRLSVWSTGPRSVSARFRGTCSLG